MNESPNRIWVGMGYEDDFAFPTWYKQPEPDTTEYVKASDEDLPALLALVGCATVEELAGQYRSLCAKVVFGQIDGATIGKAEEVLQKWNGDV